MISELTLQVEDLISKNAPDFEISKVFKTEIKTYINSLEDTLDELGGKDFFVKHTKQLDKYIILLYKYILRKHFGSYQPMSNNIPITLIALGSYGREQLCIYSDIDLMLLYEETSGYNIKAILEEFLTLAWDCGLKLGHRVHEIKDIEESVKEDVTIKTSMIESRIIYGSKLLWFSYENVLFKVRKTNQKEFIVEKLEEHKQRLLKYPLCMEPNIKDGYGGMRESNMLFWVANIIFGTTNLKDLTGREFTEDEYRKYRSALEYIFQVRNALHATAKKKLDHVNFDILPDLSKKLKFVDTPTYTKERQCMSKLLLSLHTIHWFTTIMTKKFIRHLVYEKSNISLLKKHRHSKNLYIYKNKLFSSFYNQPKTLNMFLKELIALPSSIIEFDRAYIFYASKSKIPTTQGLELKKTIKTLLYKENLSAIMKLLYNAGLFQIVLPQLKKITNQPQFDGYHKHPVDIHSIKTVWHLENISDPFIQEVYDNLGTREQKLIRIVALFHDAGKGRSLDHHIVGEKIFKELGESLDFDKDDIKLGAKLVKFHNKMSQVATNEDIYSQKVILLFTGLLQTEKTLKMLLVVTYADISAVGEHIYNSATAALLKELYLQCLPAFGNKELINESSRRIAKQESIKNTKAFKDLSRLMQKKIQYITSNQIFLQLKTNDILDIALRAQDVTDYTYKIINEKQLKIQIIRQIPLNLAFMLGKLEFLNIASMNIFKLYDEKKFFEITFSEHVEEGDLSYIEEVIQSSWDMTKKVKLKKPHIKRDEILIDCNHTQYLAEMKVKTKDQRGLFAYIAKVFDDFNIEIESAKIYTSRGKARDMFLIEKNGNFCPNQDDIVDLLCEE